MNIDLISRLLAVQKVASFTTTDMARWFSIKRPTMAAWLHGYAKPRSFKDEQLTRLLSILERALASTEFAHRVPVPLSVSQNDRANVIDQLKVDATHRFSKGRPAGRGNKVLGNNKKQKGNSEIYRNA